jgi:hypothetical protein
MNAMVEQGGKGKPAKIELIEAKAEKANDVGRLDH